MKTYNRALDYIAIAMDQHAKGRVQTAALAFTKAMAAPDVKQALGILEASNKQAFEAKAKARAEASAKAKTSVEAKAEVLQLAKLFGDNPELNASAIVAELEPEGEPETVEDEAIEEQVEEESGDAFARALASLKKAK